MTNFPQWFLAACYGGAISCLVATAVNLLYSKLTHRGPNRQLLIVCGLCICSLLLLIIVFSWCQWRLAHPPVLFSPFELAVLLMAMALFGWALPLGTTLIYCLFAQSSMSLDAQEISLEGIQEIGPVPVSNPPRYNPTITAPYVFSEDIPWGWLEYRGGNFHGQRLALKRSIVTIGRDEQCDIWLDDEMASRLHVEIAWNQQQICLTDCSSLNGTRLNGHRIQQSVRMVTNDILEIGTHRFAFVLADTGQADLDDPLSRHTWRSTMDLLTGSSVAMPSTDLFTENVPSLPFHSERTSEKMPLSVPLSPLPPTPSFSDQQFAITHQLRIVNGAFAGQTINLERSTTILGRHKSCTICLNEASLADQHAQFLYYAEGIYLLNLTQQQSIFVNQQPLQGSRRLQSGDMLVVGNLHLEYKIVQPVAIAPQPFQRPIQEGQFKRSNF